MSIGAGRLRHRIKIQQKIQTRDEIGGVVENWVDVPNWVSVPASVEDKDASELIASQANYASVKTGMLIRYCIIDTSYRVVYSGKIYNIEGVLHDKKSGREYLWLLCGTGVNQG